MKLHFSLALSLVAINLVLPVVTSARVINTPSGTIGLTEASYQQLTTEHCYFENAPDTAVHSAVTGALCDPLLARLAGHVIFRTQHYGEMYKVNDGDGLPSLVRYLPDGFYEAGDKLYWVANGYRTRLPNGDAYRRILLTAQRNSSLITYVNSSQLTQERHNALYGRIVVLVDQNNSLAYVPNELYGTELWPISEKNSDEWPNVITAIGDEVIHVNAKLLKKLPINNDWK